MNKRHFKKLKNKQFFNMVKQVKENDMLVFEFDMDKIRPELLQVFANQITSVLNNKVIFIPKDSIHLKYDTELKHIFIQQLLSEVKQLSNDMTNEEFNEAILAFLQINKFKKEE